MSSLSVAVIAGGPSSEAAVSRASAAAVHTALKQAGHRPVVLELDADLATGLGQGRFDVAFPVTHGPVGEDGCLQGLLEVLALPYVGSGVLASALAASKPHAKTMFRLAGLPVAGDALVRRGEHLGQRARQLRAELGQAVVVKPASGGSAIGVSRVAEESDDAVLVEALAVALDADDCALVESFLPGSEVTCGVLEADAGMARPLPPTRIMSRAAEWYNFESKYAAGGSEHRCPAGFDSPVTQRIQQLAVAAHCALGARDLSRVDFIVGDEHSAASVTVLELNSLPGMTATSLYPEAAAVAGLDFPTLCDLLARGAYRRPRRVVPAAVPMP
jgi:D-alanine-D-alanine ligase